MSRMEVWQGETCNLDFLSEFEFMKTAEEATANNHAVTIHSNITNQQAMITQPVIPLQTSSETPLQTIVENNEKLDITSLQQHQEQIDNNIVPLEYTLKDQPFPWHKFIEELNQYNWQQDEENRVKLLFSQIDQDVDMKPSNDNSLLVQNKPQLVENNTTQWNSNNEIKLQLKMESNIVPSTFINQESSYSNIHSLSSNAIEQGVKLKNTIKQEITEENLMEIDQVCSELTIKNKNNSEKPEVGIETCQQDNGKIDKNDPQWQNNIGNILPVDPIPLTGNNPDDILNNIPDQMKEWKILWQRTLDINELRQPSEDCSSNETNPTWQLIDCMDNTGREGIEFLLSQLGGNPIETDGLPIEGDPEEGKEQSLPDWNTAFGHKKHVSLTSTEVTPQVCDMFMNTEVQQTVLTDLTPTPIQPRFDIQAASTADNLPETSGKNNMIISINPPTSQQIEPTSTVVTLQQTTGDNVNIIIPTKNDNNIIFIPDSIKVKSQNEVKQNDNKPKCKKTVQKPCQMCGKTIKNITRHMLRVHKMKKVNGEFVPLVIPINNDDNSSNNNKKIDTQKNDDNNQISLESDMKIYIKTIIEKTKIDLNIPTLCDSISTNEHNTQDSNSSSTGGNGSNNNNNNTDNNCICALCNKGYKSKSSIIKHLQTVHKFGEKLLKCTQCSYTTVFDYIMNYHLIKHTNIPSLLCYFCQHEYRSRTCLKKHISSNHSKEMISVFGGNSRLEYLEVAKLSKNIKFEELMEKYRNKKIKPMKNNSQPSSPKIVKDLSSSPATPVISKLTDCPPPLNAILKPLPPKSLAIKKIQKQQSISPPPLVLSNTEFISLVPSISCTTKRQTLTLPIKPGSEFTVSESKQRSLILPPTFDSKVITSLSKSNSVSKKSSSTSSSSSANRLVLNSSSTVPVPNSKKRKRSLTTSSIPSTTTSSSLVTNVNNTFKLPSPVMTECKAQVIISSPPIIPLLSQQDDIMNNPSSETFPIVPSFISPITLNNNSLNMDLSQIDNVNSLQSPDSTCQNDDVSLQVVPSTSSDNTGYNEPLYLYMPTSQPQNNNIELLSPILNDTVKDNIINYPLDYSNKQHNMLPVSPLSPNSSSPSLVPNSENSSNYNNNSEMEITETDSQNSSIRYNNLEDMSFSSNEPSSSNQNSIIDETNLPILASKNVNKIKNVPVNNNKNNNIIDIPCTQCHKVFHSKQNLRSHIKNIHVSTEKIYSCSMCPYKGANKTYLKRHSKIHEKFACKLCNKKFIDEFLLKNHELSEHNNDDNNMEQQLPNNEVLENIVVENQDIVNTHNIIGITVDNLYSCHSCSNVQFKDQYLMFTHVYKNHLYSNEVSLQCLICNKTLKQKQYLKRHLKNVHKIVFS